MGNLVLSRGRREKLIISGLLGNDNIEITILTIGDSRVKLLISAPDTISVDRDEIYNKKHHDDW